MSCDRFDFGGLVTLDLQQLLLKEQIHAGISRRVFACGLNDDWVVKVEVNHSTFQNVIEYETWEYAKDGPVERWFAPCLWISPGGRVLIQKRAKALPDNFKLPPRMPSFFTDLKPDNFGLIGRRLVAVDYGYNRAIIAGLTKRTRAVAWNT